MAIDNSQLIIKPASQALSFLESPEQALELSEWQIDINGWWHYAYCYGYHANAQGQVTALSLSARAMKTLDLRWLADFPHLTTLMITDADWAGTDWAPLHALPQLRHLGIARLRRWGNNDPLLQLEQLETLVWADNRHTPAPLPQLAALPQLKHLNLTRSAIQDLDPLKHLNALQRLDLTNNNIQNLAPLQKLNALQRLNLKDTSVTDITPLEGLTNLIELDLEAPNNECSIVDITPIIGLEKLRTLSLAFNGRIQDWTPLQNLTALQSLNLRSNNIQDLAPLQNLNALQSLDLTDNNIQDLAPLQKLNALKSLNLRSNNIQDLAPLQNLSALQSLDLAETGIQDLAPLQKLSALQSLDLAQNNIQDLDPLQTLNALQSLDLSYNSGIQDLDPLQNLNALQSLNLRRNNIQDLDPLQNLNALQSLDLTDNNIQDLDPLKKLSALKSLELANNNIQDLAPLQKLIALKSLVLAATGIKDLAPLQKLSALKSLDLAGTGIQDLAPLQKLSALQSLNLRGTGIKDLAPLQKLNALQSLNLTLCKGIQDLDPLQKLNALKSLDLAATGIKDLAPLQKLSALQSLDLAATGIHDLAPLQNLNALQSLNLAKNNIQDLAPLKNLNALQSLNLWGNNIQDLAPILPLFRRGLAPTLDLLSSGEGIHLHGCPLGSPPTEVVAQGGAAIVAYFEKLSQEVAQPLNEVKVLLVGDGEAGKTSLSKGLRGAGFNPKELQTHGIQIHQWALAVPCPSGNTEITAHLWDFGGQEVMHATHQFFLTSRSCYLLVLDGRRDERPEYWLKHIESFGGRSPVLVVMNKADENPSYDLNRKDLRAKFPNIVGFYRTSCKTGEGVAALRAALETRLGGMEILQQPFPESWMAVKEWVTHLKANAQKDYISMERFREACEEERVMDGTEQESLIAIFQQLGLAFCYEHNAGTLVFNPHWLTHAVYRLINAKAVAQQAGEIRWQALGTLLQKRREGEPQYRKEHYPYILGQMVAFELCYEVERGVRWLLPDLLPETPPDYDVPAAEPIGFYFAYDFLPKSIFPRLLVAHHQQLAQGAEGALQWRSGCVLQQGDAQAEVVTDYEAKQLRLTVYAHDEMARITLLAQLRGTLETIHRSFSETFQGKVQAMVPVPGYAGAAIGYQELTEALGMGLGQLKVPGHPAQVSVAKLLKGVDLPVGGVAGKGGKVEHHYHGNVYQAEQVTAENFIQGDGNSITVTLPPDLAPAQETLAPLLRELIVEIQQGKGEQQAALLQLVAALKAPKDKPTFLGTLGKVLGHANTASSLFLNAQKLMETVFSAGV